jgi:CheY-specific phosphatase CheX
MFFKAMVAAEAVETLVELGSRFEVQMPTFISSNSIDATIPSKEVRTIIK